MSAWIDGVPLGDDTLSALRALHYGDGVFRTLLLSDGRYDALDLQLARLQHDARRLDLALPANLPAQLGAVAKQYNGVNIVKVLLSRRSAGRRGYAPQPGPSSLLLFVDSAPPPHPRAWGSGVVVRRSPLQLAAQPQLAGIKHLNRLEQVLACSGWAADQDEALMCDQRGRLISGTRSNLFVVIDGQVQTPALDRCGVAGVTRDRVIATAAALGIDYRITELRAAALARASELFLSNSVFGIWPVGRVDARRWSAPGPVTRQLAVGLAHPALALCG